MGQDLKLIKMELPDPHNDPARTGSQAPSLRHEEQCPWCGEDNQCRVAKGHLYKGPCWCHELIVPSHLLSRLTAEQIEPACLCRPCLETIARLARELDGPEAILAEAKRVASLKTDFYLDEFGNVVFTARYHLKRGSCCDNDCRHCPY
jgi:hypothetical protein